MALTACQIDPADHVVNEPVISYSSAGHNLDSLLTLYGSRKELPPGFELQTLLALSHYPELKNTRINFLIKKAFIPLSSRPSLISFYKKRHKRTYNVIISDRSLPQMENVLLKNLPFNAQVAIIGHELAHAVDYQTQNTYQLMCTGVFYLCGAYRAFMEKETDRRTIEHGLGWQLLEYAEYVREVSGSSKKQIEFIDKYYMSPKEIRDIMEGMVSGQQEAW